MAAAFRNESARQNNETERISAEESREEAEKKRSEKFNSLVDIVDAIINSGFAPEVTLEEVSNGVRITVVNAFGQLDSAQVYNGPQGEKGEKGDPGPQGVQGIQGVQGEQGIQGATGPQGVKGDKGDRGEKGDTGAQGEQGIQGIQGPQGEKGEKGDKGDKGEKGDGFNISRIFSSVAEMNAGFATDGLPIGAFVLIDTGNVQDADNARLYVKSVNGYSFLTDLSGSQGIKGDKGEKGDKGDTGNEGPQGPQGLQGLQGPEGKQGEQGPQGPQGPQGAEGPQGPQGPVGPQGPQGAEGPQGPVGPQGPQGIQGPIGEGCEIVATTGDGKNYQATVPSITALKTGVSFIMVTNKPTQSLVFEVTLNVNNFGEKKLYRKINNTSNYMLPDLAGSYPYHVMYDGQYWILTDMPVPNLRDSTGRLSVIQGGVPEATSDNAGKVLTVGESGTPMWSDLPEADLSGYQTKTDKSLATDSKEVVGAINEVNEKTIDKISAIDTYYGGAEYIEQNPYAGITWENTIAFFDEDEQVIKEVQSYQSIPILFDENTMETEIDNWGILKVKAKGDYQTKEDINLLTDSKEVVGAINELNEALYKNPPSEGLSYFVNGTYAVCSGIGTCTDSQIVIASSYLGFPVTQIAQSAFDADYYPQVSKIKSIIVPNTVERIFNYAFYGCTRLEFVVIPKSVIYIGAYAFYVNDRPKYANVYFEAEAEPSTFDGNWESGAMCNFVWGADISQKSKPQLPTASQSVVGAIAEIYHKNDVYNAEYNGSHEYTIHYPNGILKAGMTLTIVPDVANYNDFVALWWNGLGGPSVEIVRNRYDGNEITGREYVYAYWLKADFPYRVMYDGEYFVLVDYPILEIAGGEGSDNSLLGTWVFNDSVYLGYDVSAEFSFDFDVFGSGGDIEYTHPCNCMYIDGSDLRYDSYGSSFVAYNDDDGWRSDEYKTIRINSEPMNAEFVDWLKENAKKQGSSSGGSGTYPDETDFFLGTWKFKDDVTLSNVYDEFEFTVDMYWGSSYVEYTAYYYGIGCNESEVYYSDGSDQFTVFDSSGGWYEEDYRTIYIMEEPTSDEMKQWIWENATKQEDYPDDSGS